MWVDQIETSTKSDDKDYYNQYNLSSTTDRKLIKPNGTRADEKTTVKDEDHATQYDQRVQGKQIVESGVWIGANDQKHENSFVWTDGSLAQYTSE